MSTKPTYALVPINPTTAQKESGSKFADGYDLAHETYNQMIAASPNAGRVSGEQMREINQILQRVRTGGQLGGAALIVSILGLSFEFEEEE